MSEIRTRFAPSPTGALHVGGARTALFNWLFARHHGGTFVLRVEDTDAARNTPEARQAILDGLRWLGMDWDEGPEIGGDRGPYFQSERTSIHEARLEQLREAGAVYDDEGAVRFRFPQRPVTVHDQVCGDVTFDAGAEPDMTVRRPDGSFIFHFVNVIDDLEMGITHVIRGEDHLANTWKHLLLFEALGEEPPVYGHVPLILDEEGKKISKRHAGGSVQKFQESGWLPEAVRNYLCLLGWSPKDDSEKMPIEEIISRFGFEGLNRGAAQFDMDKAEWLNGQYLMELSPTAFAEAAIAHIEASGTAPDGFTAGKAAEILPLFQQKVRSLAELPAMAGFLFAGADAPPVLDDASVEKLAAREGAAGVLEAIRFEFDRLGVWEPDQITSALEVTASKLELKKGALMFPCRVGGSGSATGPDLIPMLVMLGKKRVLAAMTEVLARIS